MQKLRLVKKIQYTAALAASTATFATLECESAHARGWEQWVQKGIQVGTSAVRARAQSHGSSQGGYSSGGGESSVPAEQSVHAEVRPSYQPPPQENTPPPSYNPPPQQPAYNPPPSNQGTYNPATGTYNHRAYSTGANVSNAPSYQPPVNQHGVRMQRTALMHQAHPQPVQHAQAPSNAPKPTQQPKEVDIPKVADTKPSKAFDAKWVDRIMSNVKDKLAKG